jgi:hypothetical protein
MSEGMHERLQQAERDGFDVAIAMAEMKAKAKLKHGKITPCAGKEWGDCLTINYHKGVANWVLWFNDSQNSTHVIMEKM